MADNVPARLPVTKRLAWWFGYAVVASVFLTLYRTRVRGREHVPRTGGALVASNHQSFFDPVMVALATWPRPFFSLARHGLFTSPAFAALIKLLNAIPLRQGESDKAALRQGIEVLNQGHLLAVYPEGARTWDGRVQRFEPGIILLAKRSGVPVIPMAIRGAHEAWPRGTKWPRLTGRIRVAVGQVISAQQIKDMGSDAAAEVQKRVEALYEQLG